MEMIRVISSPRGAWGTFAREIVTDVTPGDHFQILSRHYEGLAKILSRRLKEALDDPSLTKDGRRPQ